MKLGKRRLGAASCLLRHSDALPPHLSDIVEVAEVYTEEWHRGKGIADRLIKAVCEDADKHGTVLMLMPNNDRLEAWYSRHGFVKIQTEPVIMARQAR